ncbi:gp04 putative replication protein [Iodobacter phage PhiPLPE]|uniref:Gp04 putative replication protein n=1 Tax=Iodobacter phage PhiPLPE TaxID=551895 RepID=B5AX23_9CAUD|nr:DnaD-like helicase loader [Iodobacter phage PhiPLPE]ACG60326.1 gp04 putative replication protein [Iodobacter phage PhiPLPE]
MELWPKNWSEFQHYKNRSPAWIKLHANILDDYDFCVMHVASRALAPMLWLLASKYENGKINESPTKLAFKLRMTLEEFIYAVKPLIDNKFFHADSEMLAECLQDACLEKRERRGEKEREEEESREGAKQKTDSPAARVSKKDDPIFEEAWAVYPKRPNNSKAAALKAWTARVKNGADPADMILGVKRYAKYCEVMRTEPNFIKQASTFFGPDQHYLSEFDAKPSTGKAGMPAAVSERFRTDYDRTEAVALEIKRLEESGIDLSKITDEDLIF